MKTALLMISAIIAAGIVQQSYAIHESPVPVNTPKNNFTTQQIPADNDTKTEAEKETEAEKVAKRERFYAPNPDIPRPDDISTEGYENRRLQDSMSESTNQNMDCQGTPENPISIEQLVQCQEQESENAFGKPKYKMTEAEIEQEVEECNIRTANTTDRLDELKCDNLKEDRIHAINTKNCAELPNLLERAPCQFKERERHSAIAGNSSFARAMNDMIGSPSGPQSQSQPPTEEDKKTSALLGINPLKEDEEAYAQLGIKLSKEGEEEQQKFLNPTLSEEEEENEEE